MLKYALLGFLNYRSMTGYDLKRVMDTSTTNFWHADLSQIYKTLRALEADGAITSQIETQEERPDKKIYSITEKGQADLQKWLTTPLTEMTPIKETLLLKVFFSASGDSDHLLMQLRLQRELHQQNLEKYQQQTLADMAQNAAFIGATPDDVLYWEATRRAGELYESMYIRWLDETIDRIEKQRS